TVLSSFPGRGSQSKFSATLRDRRAVLHPSPKRFNVQRGTSEPLCLLAFVHSLGRQMIPFDYEMLNLLRCAKAEEEAVPVHPVQAFLSNASRARFGVTARLLPPARHGRDDL